MAICAHLNNNNRIVANSTPVDSCTDYVLLSATEHTDLPSLTEIFAIPLAADLQQMFMTGVSIPLIAYLSAWGYGVVINWFNKPNY